MANPEFARTIPDAPAEGGDTIPELTGPSTKVERSLVKPQPDQERLAGVPEAKVESDVLSVALDQIADRIAPLEQQFYAPTSQDNWDAREVVVLDTLKKIEELNRNFLGYLESVFDPELASSELIKKVHDTAFRTHQLEVRVNVEAKNYLARYSDRQSREKRQKIEELKKKISGELSAVNPDDVFATPSEVGPPKSGNDTDVGRSALKEMRGEFPTGNISSPAKESLVTQKTQVVDTMDFIPTQTLTEIPVLDEEPTISEKEIQTVVAETPTVVEPNTVVEEPTVVNETPTVVNKDIPTLVQKRPVAAETPTVVGVDPRINVINE